MVSLIISSRAAMAIILATLGKVDEVGYVINAHCRPCRRHSFLDRPALIAARHGERDSLG